MKVKYIVIFLLVLLFLQGFIGATMKSRTIDELNYHLNGGYTYLTTGRWETGINNPPLTATLAAVPLLFVKDTSVFNRFDRVRQQEYIFEEKEQFPKHLLLIARMIPITFMILLGIVVFLWGRDLYGPKAGLFALFLYSFSPNIIGYGRLVTADIGGTLFIVASLYTFWKFIHNPTKKNLAIAAVVFGLAQITKMLAIFLIPTFTIYALLVFLFKKFDVDYLLKLKNAGLQKGLNLFIVLMIIFLSGLLIMNTMYLWKGTFTPLKSYDGTKFESSTFKDLHANKLVNWIPMPIPRAYVIGHDQAQWQAKDEVRGFFFWGVVKERFKSYYLGHILIKTHLAIFILIILGFVFYRKLTLTELYIIIFILMVLLPLTFLSKLAIGYRHVLSIYPLMFLLACRVFQRGIPKNIGLAVIVGICSVWYLVSAVLIFPHHIAYFNEIIGGPKNGYKYTIDSNLDWEQDLDLVKKYLRESGEQIHVDPGCVAWTGKAVIPANSLQFQKGGCYLWLKQNFEPIDNIGYSWLVYDVRGTWHQTDNGFQFVKG